MLPATISWFAALTVCPEPFGPTWTTVFPTTSRIGFAELEILWQLIRCFYADPPR